MDESKVRIRSKKKGGLSKYVIAVAWALVKRLRKKIVYHAMEKETSHRITKRSCLVYLTHEISRLVVHMMKLKPVENG